MQLSTSRTATIVMSTVLAATVTLGIGWPRTVTAVGNEEQALAQQGELAQQQAAPENVALGKDQSKIGDLEVTAVLALSETAPDRQVIRLECNNPTEGRIAGRIQLALTRTKGNAMERVMPSPQIAWRHNETVEVAAGETLVREVALPNKIGAEVTRIARAQKLAEESESGKYPNVYYGVVAEAVEMPAGKAPDPQRLALQKTKAPAARVAAEPKL